MMGMRDWLLIIVITGIVLILLDGYRRKRKSRIRVKLDKNIPAGDTDDAEEFPNGGARVVNRNGNLDESECSDGAPQKGDQKEQEDQVVPVLMDAVDTTDINVTDSPAYHEESDLDLEYFTGKGNVFEEYSEDSAEETGIEKQESKDLNIDNEEIHSFSGNELEGKPPYVTQGMQSNVQEESLVIDQTELFAESPGRFNQTDEEDGDSEVNNLEAEEVIVINVMAKEGELFTGSDLLPVLLQQGMQLGGMSIFHKYADSSGNGPAIFSMANMVKPGTFDAAQMEKFSTPGVSFILQLPNAFGNMKSFEQMLSAADLIKKSLNGDLKDEYRSVITRQTIEHCRQRIQDFELAQLSKK